MGDNNKLALDSNEEDAERQRCKHETGRGIECGTTCGAVMEGAERRMACRSAAARDGVRDGAVCGTRRSTRDGEISLFCTLGQIKPDFLARYDFFVPSDRVFGSFSVH